MIDPTELARLLRECPYLELEPEFSKRPGYVMRQAGDATIESLTRDRLHRVAADWLKARLDPPAEPECTCLTDPSTGNTVADGCLKHTTTYATPAVERRKELTVQSGRCVAFGATTGRRCVLENDHEGECQLEPARSVETDVNHKALMLYASHHSTAPILSTGLCDCAGCMDVRTTLSRSVPGSEK